MIERVAPILPVILAVVADTKLPDPSSAAAVGWWVLTAAGVLTIVKLCMDLWKDHFRESPAPSQTYVTIAACEAHRAKIEKRIDDCNETHTSGDAALEDDIKSLGAKIDEATKAMQSEASRRASTVHQRMDNMARTLACVEERSESTQAELRLLNQNIMSFLRENRQ